MTKEMKELFQKPSLMFITTVLVFGGIFQLKPVFIDILVYTFLVLVVRKSWDEAISRAWMITFLAIFPLSLLLKWSFF